MQKNNQSKYEYTTTNSTICSIIDTVTSKSK